ncbi:hypothetical protein ABEB36_003198 [Hypothenemus hampei]|uniref:Uncharacterized protein n=1 Tax=Hypothenemus hampei TaxID=57062 RepID=A0ABD1F8C1_HYPHA
MPGVHNAEESELQSIRNNENHDQQVEEVRELTQNDRINRHLLAAFLQTINRRQEEPLRSNEEDTPDSEWLNDDNKSE